MTVAKKPELECQATHHLLVTLTRPWSLHILLVLHISGPTRFGELRRKLLGISSRILTARLRHMEEMGFVNRVCTSTRPPQVTYSLTERTKELGEPMTQLDALAKKWAVEDLTNKQPQTQKAAYRRKATSRDSSV
ncbi:MAG: helix-turn-helix transcriptional regulator [Leptolyngbya sp.]|nr:helix-turn-helix transcriptional regulator [Candidatus Melainabacteria bacterium]